MSAAEVMCELKIAGGPGNGRLCASDGQYGGHGTAQAIFAKPVALTTDGGQGRAPKGLSNVTRMTRTVNNLEGSGRFPEGRIPAFTQPDGSQWMCTASWERP